ncbi:MAG: hypothetical protein U1F39_04535 [Steroidobacteraceae bacterium]
MHLQRIAAAVFMSLAFHSLPVAAADPTIRLCRSYVQGRIDVLDAELHKGIKPNEASRLVKRRDKLKAQLAECERNPKAYKKDI